MLGYDTLQGAWNEIERDWDAVPWQSVQVTTSGVVKRTLNRPLVQLTRIESNDPATGAIRQLGTTFQCSLPKVLYGNNVRELPPSDVPAALDALHKLLLEDIPGCCHPSLMTPRRIDATDNRQLGSEQQVRAVLRACQVYKLGRTKPYIGDSGSVNWPGKSGGHRSKVYSKYRDLLRPGREVDEDLCVQAEGVLRVEVGAVGLKSIRSDIAKVMGVAFANGDMSVGTALGCLGLPGAILGPLNGIVDDVIGSEVIDMKQADFVKAFIDAGFSYPNAISKMGWAAAVREYGWDGLMLTRQGIYKLKKEFVKAGVDPLELELGPLMVRLTKPYAAGKREIVRLKQKQAKEDAVAVSAPIFGPAIDK